MMQRVVVFGGFLLAACGPQAGATPQTPAPEASAAPAAAPAEETGPTTATEAPSETPPQVAPEKPTAESKPVVASIHDVCFAMCDKLKPKCPKSSFEACQLNCGKYDPPAEGCEEVVRAALSCARDASDLVCANVAPESCAKPFRRIAACASGKSVAEAAPTGAVMPAEFSVYENAQEGIVAPMPQGVAPGQGDTVAQVKHAEGALYSIRKLPRPEGKLNEKLILKIAMGLFGRCTDKMKMSGMVDKPGRTSINYTMKCPDGSEAQGLFWATSKALFVASAKGDPGKLGPTEAFLYGFEAK
jgi:hypothetical protein